MQQYQYPADAVPSYDDLGWALYHRAPTFDSIPQFGQFCVIVLERWHRPAPPSISGHMLELAELGVRVDTSPAPASAWEPRAIYHLSWIERVFRDARRELPAPRLVAWAGHDVEGRPQVELAAEADVSPSTISEWVHGSRDVLAALLAELGMMDRSHLSRWSR